eukprot:g29583.t1
MYFDLGKSRSLGLHAELAGMNGHAAQALQSMAKPCIDRLSDLHCVSPAATGRPPPTVSVQRDEKRCSFFSLLGRQSAEPLQDRLRCELEAKCVKGGFLMALHLIKVTVMVLQPMRWRKNATRAANMEALMACLLMMRANQS